VDVARRIGGDAGGAVELPRAAARLSGLAGVDAGLELAGAVAHAPAVSLDERAGGGELVDPIAALICDVDVARRMGDDAVGAVELPGAAAREPGLAAAGAGLEPAGAVAHAPAVSLDERAGGGELVQPIVDEFGDVDVAGGIGGDTSGAVELPC